MPLHACLFTHASSALRSRRPCHASTPHTSPSLERCEHHSTYHHLRFPRVSRAQAALNDAREAASAQRERAVQDAVAAAEQHAAETAEALKMEAEAAVARARRDGELAVEAAVQHAARSREGDRARSEQEGTELATLRADNARLMESLHDCQLALVRASAPPRAPDEGGLELCVRGADSGSVTLAIELVEGGNGLAPLAVRACVESLNASVSSSSLPHIALRFRTTRAQTKLHPDEAASSSS